MITSLCLSLASNTYASSDETHHGTPHLKHHNIGLFLGQTNADETDFSYGFGYEYRFNQRWGVGLTHEKTNDAHHQVRGRARPT